MVEGTEYRLDEALGVVVRHPVRLWYLAGAAAWYRRSGLIAAQRLGRRAVPAAFLMTSNQLVQHVGASAAGRRRPRSGNASQAAMWTG